MNDPLTRAQMAVRALNSYLAQKLSSRNRAVIVDEYAKLGDALKELGILKSEPQTEVRQVGTETRCESSGSYTSSPVNEPAVTE